MSGTGGTRGKGDPGGPRAGGERGTLPDYGSHHRGDRGSGGSLGSVDRCTSPTRPRSEAPVKLRDNIRQRQGMKVGGEEVPLEGDESTVSLGAITTEREDGVVEIGVTWSRESSQG